MKGLFAFFIVLIPLFLKAQERCATNYTEVNQSWIIHPDRFESWMDQKKSLLKYSQTFSTSRTTETYTLPVVFHIVHNGEPVGEGSNLSEDKILEQLDILNKDFRRMNDDASSTPPVFLPVAADTEIEFVLARQDPEGLPTSGITRKKGSKTQYSSSQDDQLLKSEIYWPAEDYLNIWVTNISGGFLGYAQYPFANLPGIESEFQNYRLTDGMVVDYEWVGINEDTPSFDSYGRTLTHEMGHFLGLRHIWGDGGCSVDDYCEDTPPASGSYTGKSPPCEFPDDLRQCSDDAPMFQNFMDYTDDACMNIFTLDQKERMRLVLDYSPRRNSLLNSPGLTAPIQISNDLGIRRILSPLVEDCDNTLNPILEIRNYGTNTITTYAIGLYINDNLIETVNGVTNLIELETEQVNFSEHVITEGITNHVRFEVLSVNGNDDNNILNNSEPITLLPTEVIPFPFHESFENELDLTPISEFGGPSEWTVTTAPDNNALNQAASIDFYDQTTNIGSLDMLVTKNIDLSSLSSALLSFKYAYAPRSDSTFLDGLIVGISTNCGSYYDVNDYLFEEYGHGLGTVFPRTKPYAPVSPDDWEEVLINLTSYTGNSNVQIAFIGVNGGGNRLFLDSITVNSDNLLAYDIGLRQVSNLSPVSCEKDIFPILELKNYGSETIDDVVITFESEFGTQEVEFKNQNIISGESKSVTLEDSLTDGTNQLRFELKSVNQRIDENAANNLVYQYIELNENSESIPVRQDFEYEPWSIAEKQNQPLFEETSINGNKALVAKAYESTTIGSESWLVSPILNTNGYLEAALRFNISYAVHPLFVDNLKVLLSTNCGISYDEIIYDKNSEDLAITESANKWIPLNDEDWKREFISLTEILQLGEDEQVNNFRIAFVFQNGTGNDLYLDDIEVLTIDDPDYQDFTNKVTLYPNPVTSQSFKVAFNLELKEDLRIQLIDISGRLLLDKSYPETLNQVYRFETPSQSGFYFMKIIGQSFIETKRLFIGQ